MTLTVTMSDDLRKHLIKSLKNMITLGRVLIDLKDRLPYLQAERLFDAHTKAQELLAELTSGETYTIFDPLYPNPMLMPPSKGLKIDALACDRRSIEVNLSIANSRRISNEVNGLWRDLGWMAAILTVPKAMAIESSIKGANAKSAKSKEIREAVFTYMYSLYKTRPRITAQELVNIARNEAPKNATPIVEKYIEERKDSTLVKLALKVKNK